MRHGTYYPKQQLLLSKTNGRKNILGVHKEVGLLMWMRTAMKDLLEEGTGF